MNAFLNIPAHKNCNNCGDCCGVIPATTKEIELIKKHLRDNPNIKPVNENSIECPFRDIKIKRCLIYPVRPLVCRLMGVVKGMECQNGNSAEINGSKFVIAMEPSDIKYLNDINWKEV